jgi:hypothetical protein
MRASPHAAEGRELAKLSGSIGMLARLASSQKSWSQ